MISFNDLGNLGRLGNQMFQYAVLRGVAALNGYEWCVPPPSATGQNLYDCFKLAGIRNYGTTDFPTVRHFGLCFHPGVMSLPDNTNLLGYFQSEKYFSHIGREIVEDFTFKSEHVGKAEEFLHGNGKGTVSLHVRRTDYLQSLRFYTNIFEAGYYQKAMSMFHGLKFLVFSDDIEWCKNQDIFASARFSEGNSGFTDLCLMSMCEHNIIANSSFSWWGAYLNRNPSKRVVAPEKWVGPGYGKCDIALSEGIEVI
jgi:hypothetical protein